MTEMDVYIGAASVGLSVMGVALWFVLRGYLDG